MTSYFVRSAILFMAAGASIKSLSCHLLQANALVVSTANPTNPLLQGLVTVACSWRHLPLWHPHQSSPATGDLLSPASASAAGNKELRGPPGGDAGRDVSAPERETASDDIHSDVWNWTACTRHPDELAARRRLVWHALTGMTANNETTQLTQRRESRLTEYSNLLISAGLDPSRMTRPREPLKQLYNLCSISLQELSCCCLLRWPRNHA